MERSNVTKAAGESATNVSNNVKQAKLIRFICLKFKHFLDKPLQRLEVGIYVTLFYCHMGRMKTSGLLPTVKISFLNE